MVALREILYMNSCCFPKDHRLVFRSVILLVRTMISCMALRHYKFTIIRLADKAHWTVALFISWYATAAARLVNGSFDAWKLSVCVSSSAEPRAKLSDAPANTV